MYLFIDLFICYTGNYVFSTSRYKLTAPNSWMMMNNYLENVWKETNSVEKPKGRTSLETASLRT